jgi:hypothetical protein
MHIYTYTKKDSEEMYELKFMMMMMMFTHLQQRKLKTYSPYVKYKSVRKDMSTRKEQAIQLYHSKFWYWYQHDNDDSHMMIMMFAEINYMRGVIKSILQTNNVDQLIWHKYRK